MTETTQYDVVVVGAGASGMLAGAKAAERGRRTLLLEKNRRPGVKILISGGTRCNLTHDTDNRGIIEAYGKPGRFLHSALAALSPSDVVALVEAEGVATKIEETGKIFPVSDRATDVLAALLAIVTRSGCDLACNEPLLSIERHENAWRLRTTTRVIATEKLVITTGGQSYPGCGTTGDAYPWARELGHTLIPPRPALVPITTSANWVQALKGITIPDVEVQVVEPANADDQDAGARRSAVLAKRRGSFLFTHFGLSGPAALDVSRAISGHPHPSKLQLQCDFCPHITAGEIEIVLREAATTAGKRQASTLLPDFLPKRLIEALIANVGVDAERRAAEISKAERTRLVQAVKQAVLPIAGTRGFSKAEVTAGGVSLEEVDSHTMQSKLAPNLYWAGEVLDLDGPIGGYNFQAAFSTGWLAGLSV